MAVVVTPVYQYLESTEQGVMLANAKFKVTGLPANQNTAISHGLKDAFGNGKTPLQVGLEPKSNSNFWEYQDADGTNIYIGVGATTGTHAVDVYLVF